MVVSLHKMTAGHGVDYLMSTVVVGDGDRDLGTPLTRYYTEAGTPPGTWLGRGLPDIGSDELGRVAVGDVVTEMQLRRLFEEGRDPITGVQLGKANGAYVRPPRNWRARSGASCTGPGRC